MTHVSTDFSWFAVNLPHCMTRVVKNSCLLTGGPDTWWSLSQTLLNKPEIKIHCRLAKKTTHKMSATFNKFASAPKGPRALRSLLQRKSSLFPSPPPPCRLDPKSCRAGLEIFGVRRRPAPWGQITKKLLFCPEKHDLLLTCLRLGSGPAQPATRLLARPVSPAHPESGPSLSETGLPSKPSPARSPGPGASLGRPQSKVCLTCLTGQRLVSRV